MIFSLKWVLMLQRSNYRVYVWKQTFKLLACMFFYMNEKLLLWTRWINLAFHREHDQPIWWTKPPKRTYLTLHKHYCPHMFCDVQKTSSFANMVKPSRTSRINFNCIVETKNILNRPLKCLQNSVNTIQLCF